MQAEAARGPDRATIVVFGSINMDLVARVATIPRPGETVLSPGYETFFGGKGANQAVAAAHAVRGTDVAVAMVGQVGEDAFGHAARANLAAHGVSVAGVVTGAAPTGCAFITVDESGENAITVASGANGAVNVAALSHAFTARDVLVLQMEVPFAQGLAAARQAKAGGARVLWNLAPAPRAFPRASLAELLDACDLLVVNEHEAIAAAGASGLDVADAQAAADALAKAAGPAIILTAGARGAFAFAPNGVRHHAEAPAVKVVDTTGAGDTFVGVLAAELATGRDLPWSLASACRAAALACARAGAQPTAPICMDPGSPAGVGGPVLPRA